MIAALPRYARPRPDRLLGLTPAVWTGVLAVLALAALEVLARTVVDPIDLVPPSTMVVRTAELLGTAGFVTGQVLPSLGLIAAAFALAGVAGVGLAYTMWRSPWWRRALQPYLNVYYAIPIFAVYPILVVLLGTGGVPIVLLSAAFGAVVVVTNSLLGFDSVPEPVRKLARSRNLDARRYLTAILLPAALPDIADGLRLGLVYATIGVLATEFILSTRGLGHEIADAYHTFRTADMYAGILLICLLALALNVAVGAVLDRLDWRRR